MIPVVAGVDQEADRFRRRLTDEPDELRGQIAVQHGLDNKDAPLTDYKPGSGGYVVFVEHVIWQDREHAGGELF
jgi:hypothetical protein